MSALYETWIKWRERLDVIPGQVDGVNFVWITVAGLGGCEMCFDGETAGLRRMFVLKRRQGVGTAMFYQAIQEAQKRGMLAVAFTVRKTNPEALQFYAKMGAKIFSDDPYDYHMGINLEGEAK